MDNNNKVGRPLKFKNPKEVEKRGMAYIDKCRKTKRPITVTGLCLELNTSRETLMNYERKDKFFDTIKKLKLFAENYAEERLFTGRNTVGAIFALKNFGWKDSYEFDKKNRPTSIMSEEERVALRKKVSSFTEDSSKIIKMPE